MEAVLARYEQARAGEAFGRQHPLWDVFRSLESALRAAPAVAARPTVDVSAVPGIGGWARVPYVTLLDTRETRTPRQGVYAAYLFREDLSGVYLALGQGVTDARRQLGATVARATLRRRAQDLRAYAADLPGRDFRLDDLLDLRTAEPGLGQDYEASVIAHKLYEADAVPDDAALAADLDALLAAYDRYLLARRTRSIAPAPPAVRERGRRPYGATAEEWDAGSAVGALVDAIRRRGFVYEPWTVAAYVAALRTKPFAILAGVSGTGKSRLPQLVERETGGVARVVPVRPDWTDSGESLGYTDLAGAFRPGPVLGLAREAATHPARHHALVLDEMNLARPEHYLAEVLSRMEDRAPHPVGGYATPPLLAPGGAPDEWRGVGLPPNLAVVGTVNMDESAHTFSRKVLDRAFVIELSDTDLSDWERDPADATPPALPDGGRWPIGAWLPRATRLGELAGLPDPDRRRVGDVVDTVVAASALLGPAGLAAGYRTRDEIALFVLHAGDVAASMTDAREVAVDPLDLALCMKLLPRVAGGSRAIRRTLLGLLGWAHSGDAAATDAYARDLLDAWDEAGRPAALGGARFPRTAARLCLMWERLDGDGFTSFWA